MMMMMMMDEHVGEDDADVNMKVMTMMRIAAVIPADEKMVRGSAMFHSTHSWDRKARFSHYHATCWKRCAARSGLFLKAAIAPSSAWYRQTVPQYWTLHSNVGAQYPPSSVLDST